jgi:hypothetical protein
MPTGRRIERPAATGARRERSVGGKTATQLQSYGRRLRGDEPRLPRDDPRGCHDVAVVGRGIEKILYEKRRRPNGLPPMPNDRFGTNLAKWAKSLIPNSVSSWPVSAVTASVRDINLRVDRGISLAVSEGLSAESLR